MKATSGLCAVIALVLSACASVDGQVNPKVDNKVASEANTQLGIAYLREGNYDMARLKLEKAVELEPDNATTQEATAILYEQVGEYEKAEQHYRKTLKLQPDYARGHNNYGQFLCARGRFEDAEEQFLLAANNPFYSKPSLPLTNAGLCAERVPDLARAESFFRQALEKDPRFAPALLQMGLISYEQGKYMNARGYLQRFEAVAPHTSESLWLAIRTEYELGDHQAWGNYAVLLESRFPDSEEAMILKDWESERRSQK